MKTWEDLDPSEFRELIIIALSERLRGRATKKSWDYSTKLNSLRQDGLIQEVFRGSKYVSYIHTYEGRQLVLKAPDNIGSEIFPLEEDIVEAKKALR